MEELCRRRKGRVAKKFEASMEDRRHLPLTNGLVKRLQKANLKADLEDRELYREVFRHGDLVTPISRYCCVDQTVIFRPLALCLACCRSRKALNIARDRNYCNLIPHALHHFLRYRVISPSSHSHRIAYISR